jgi:hypothetical protein
MRYIKGTMGHGLVLGGKEDTPLLEVHADSDYAHEMDRKSTSGFTIRFRGSTIVAASKKQKGVSTSTLEAEFVALSTACKSLLWLRSLLYQLGYTTPTTIVHSDNQAAILATKNGTHSDAAKHIDVAHKFGREQYELGLIDLRYIKSAVNVADVLTKALSEDGLTKHRQEMGVVDTTLPRSGQSGSVERRAAPS